MLRQTLVQVLAKRLVLVTQRCRTCSLRTQEIGLLNLKPATLLGWVPSFYHQLNWASKFSELKKLNKNECKTPSLDHIFVSIVNTRPNLHEWEGTYACLLISVRSFPCIRSRHTNLRHATRCDLCMLEFMIMFTLWPKQGTFPKFTIHHLVLVFGNGSPHLWASSPCT